jgi:hypothetical protein
MWSSLVKVLEKHGVMNPNFKGFTDDSAQANFMQFGEFLELVIQQFRCLIKSALVCFTGLD